MDLKRSLRQCGQDVVIAPGVVIERPEAVELGDRVRLMAGTHIAGSVGDVVIGDDVTFMPGCFVDGNGGTLQVADRVTFFPGAFLSLGDIAVAPSWMTIGSDTHFAPYGVLYGWGGLTIGSCVNVAAHVVLATVGHFHHVLDKPMAFSGERWGPITVEDDVWIGANATVTSDVTLAAGSVVGANAVVTRNTEPLGIYGGVPARRIGTRGEP